MTQVSAEVSTQGSTPGGVAFLLGESRGDVAALALVSVVTGFVESAILAVVAEAAAAIVDGSRKVSISVASAHGSLTVGALLVVGLALALVRFVLQGPMSTLPARMAARVQAGIQRIAQTLALAE